MGDPTGAGVDTYLKQIGDLASSGWVSGSLKIGEWKGNLNSVRELPEGIGPYQRSDQHRVRSNSSHKGNNTFV